MVLGIVFLYLFNTFPCFHLHQNMIFPIREGDQICLAYLVRGDQIREGGPNLLSVFGPGGPNPRGDRIRGYTGAYIRPIFRSRKVKNLKFSDIDAGATMRVVWDHSSDALSVGGGFVRQRHTLGNGVGASENCGTREGRKCNPEWDCDQKGTP